MGPLGAISSTALAFPLIVLGVLERGRYLFAPVTQHSIFLQMKAVPPKAEYQPPEDQSPSDETD